MVEQERWLTVAEVAARLKLTEDTIRRWCQSGRLQATLLSRRAGYRIPASQVELLLRGDDAAEEISNQGGTSQ